MPRAAVATALLVLALALAGCGLGPGKKLPGGARLEVTRDFGQSQLGAYELAAQIVGVRHIQRGQLVTGRARSRQLRQEWLGLEAGAQH